MDTTAILAELAKAIPVVVGGLLAIGGGLGSQVFVHRLAERRELTKLRRERLEALVKAVYAHAQWLDAKRVAMIFRNEDHDVHSPLDDARMLQALYFPELGQQLVAIQEAQIPMLEFIGKHRLKHMESKEKLIAEWNAEPYNTAYRSYLEATGDLVSKCQTLLTA